MDKTWYFPKWNKPIQKCKYHGSVYMGLIIVRYRSRMVVSGGWGKVECGVI